ncbi:hypothetical protein FGO68_gene7101 [Halteria grandinella]|uniref:Uncharacterized protein n=1 Tax=Halteria grandinella TaxID=5974 RepID=A0A8J8T801_HALGN|nr:hypothetical protein FGO68_gene7101 [Halteria grandinella]
MYFPSEGAIDGINVTILVTLLYLVNASTCLISHSCQQSLLQSLSLHGGRVQFVSPRVSIDIVILGREPTKTGKQRFRGGKMFTVMKSLQRAIKMSNITHLKAIYLCRSSRVLHLPLAYKALYRQDQCSLRSIHSFFDRRQRRDYRLHLVLTHR